MSIERLRGADNQGAQAIIEFQVAPAVLSLWAGFFFIAIHSGGSHVAEASVEQQSTCGKHETKSCH